VGCGTGELLVGARAEGWDVAGIDATDWARTKHGIAIELAPAETAKTLDRAGAYDVVLLAAILEHLYDPLPVLRRIHHALAPDGIVFVDVPNECGLWTRAGNAYLRLRGRGWAVNLSPTFPPYHVIGFCPASLRRALSSVGFAVLEMTTPRWNNQLPRRPGLLAALERASAEIVLTAGAAMGHGAGIVCWARKAAPSADRA
jgi:SAM-dependent methyltransferase